jgi:hypothetical protein
MIQMGFPPMVGAPSPFYNGFMSPWPFPQEMVGQVGQPGQRAQGSAGNTSNASGDIDPNIEFPEPHVWVKYCDTVPRRSRAQLGRFSDLLHDHCFFEITQLTRRRLSPTDLANDLHILLGIAELMSTYAEEDVKQVQAGNFDMNMS